MSERVHEIYEQMLTREDIAPWGMTHITRHVWGVACITSNRCLVFS
jgi:hypothetical protein